MNSNTSIPGMNGLKSNPYSRQSFQHPNEFSSQGTYVPGMQNSACEEDISSNGNQANNAPVVGFLYSISRFGIGEFWPLHLGANTIGRSGNCDVQLKEMSVSDTHATISIKQMKSTKKLIASIRDVGSKNGIFLNEEELDYENHSCKSRDLITIGSCYKLVLLLIDANEYNLSVAENFVPVEDNCSDAFSASPYERIASDSNRTVDLSGRLDIDTGGTQIL